MRKLIVLSLIAVLFFAANLFAKDSAYDQATGTSRDSWQAEKVLSTPGSYDELNSSWERSRKGASQGFDIQRSSNLSGGGMQYIPTPTPKIEKDGDE